MKGGKVLGQYPDDLTDEGPLALGRGEAICSIWRAGIMQLSMIDFL